MNVRRIIRIDAARVRSLCVLLLIAMYCGSVLSYIYAVDIPPLQIMLDGRTSWPTSRRNNERTGHYDGPALQVHVKVTPKPLLLWMANESGFTTGDWVMASPAVADGLLFVGSFDHTFYCLNTTNGRHVWNYTTGDMISASPAVANGIVYVGSLDGAVYAFGVLASQYMVEPDGYQFDVEIMSNSQLSAFTFDQSMKTLRVNVTGDAGTDGFCAVTFPTALLGGPYVCQLNGTLITPEVAMNATHTTLAFTYLHSTHMLEIIGTTVIPEYPTLLTTLLPLLVLAATLLHTLGRGRRPRTIDP